MPLSELLVLISSYLLLLLLLAGELAIFLIARIYPSFSVFLALNVRFFGCPHTCLNETFCNIHQLEILSGT
jgi:hypothetical protein